MRSGQRQLQGPRREWIAFHIQHTTTGREENADILLFESKWKFIFSFTLFLVWDCAIPGMFFRGLHCSLYCIQHLRSALCMWIKYTMQLFVSTAKSALWLHLKSKFLCHTIKLQNTDWITTLCVIDFTVSGVYWDLRGLKRRGSRSGKFKRSSKLTLFGICSTMERLNNNAWSNENYTAPARKEKLIALRFHSREVCSFKHVRAHTHTRGQEGKHFYAPIQHTDIHTGARGTLAASWTRP